MEQQLGGWIARTADSQCYKSVEWSRAAWIECAMVRWRSVSMHPLLCCCCCCDCRCSPARETMQAVGSAVQYVSLSDMRDTCSSPPSE